MKFLSKQIQEYEHSLSEKTIFNLKDFDFVINRLNPPFNKEYLYLTNLLKRLV